MENENDIKTKIGVRIKSLRNEIGLTQEQLADKLPNLKGKSSIANYENGSNLPSDEVKLKMCELFNCTLDYLMCKSEIRNPEELKNIQFANSGGLDIEGLTDRDIEELKAQIEFKRRYNKEKKEGN